MKKINSILIFCLMTACIAAQNVKFTAGASKHKVATGERFQITFESNASASNFTPPSFPGFRILSGPNQSSNYQWVNGVASNSLSWSYVLLALKQGKFTIAAAKIKVGGEIHKTEPITIEVVKGAAVQQQQKQHQHVQQAQSDGSDLSKNVFIKLHVNKTSAYQGEQLIATYKIYYRLSIIDNNVNKLPDFNGFWSQEIELSQKGNNDTEVIKGVAYNTAIIKKVVLFPQKSGTLEIDPIELETIVRVRKKATSVFDQFFGSYKDVKYNARSNSAKVTVKPLPEKGKPKGFSGAVGDYTLQAKMDKYLVKANEAINLKITLAGSGNIKLLESVKVNFPPDFEIYDPKIYDRISVTGSGVSGKREYEYLAIPRHAGTYKIEPVNFSYFNPKEKKYTEIESGGFAIEVEKGTEEEGQEAFHSVSKENVKLLGRDIRFIKQGTANLKEKERFFFLSPLFYSLAGLPLLSFLLFIFIRRKYVDYSSDIIRVKSRKATRIAKKRLTLAKKHLSEGNSTLFYEEVFKASYGYLGDKLSIPVSELSKDNISDILLSKAVSEETTSRLTETLDRCEMARFSPSSEVSEQEVYEQAVEMISNVEEELK